MARVVNIDTTTPHAKDYSGTANWGVNINERGTSYAISILNEWNIQGLGSGSSFDDNTLSPYQGRSLDSVDRVTCEDWQGIIIIANTKSKQAIAKYSKGGYCGKWKTKCKRSAKIDEVKWDLISAYAMSMDVAQSSSGNYDTCAETELSVEIDALLQEQQDYVDELKGSSSMSNIPTYAIIGVATMATIYLTLKFVK